LIVYSATKAKFKDDVMTNDIGNIILDAFQSITGRGTSKSEIDSWVNSLQFMDRVLTDDEIPHDAGVAIEYHLPQTSKRIDFILTGQDRDRRESAILVELKQWEKAELTQSDGVVITRFKRGPAETLHPSYQAWSYKQLLEDFNQTVQEEHIGLYPCAYLHNYEDDGVITNPFYGEYLNKAPVFLKPDALKLQHFIKTYVRYGDTTQIMYRIEYGKIKPSKNLADELASMLRGNREFVLIDDQKVVFEKAKWLAQQASEHAKKVLIVEGGPGTGKSVLAINLLVALGQQFFVQYVTRNSAPRLVYEARLTGHFKRTRISNMFSGSGSFHAVPPNIFQCLIVDEAHRLNEKSGMFSHLGENQIKEIISASKLSVFFIDEDQKVTLKDIGDKETIRTWAKKLGAEVIEANLESQFRCNGSNGYLAWLDNTLQIRETANKTLDTREYDFRIVDSPAGLHDLIRTKNKISNKARIVAGYCWDWISKKKPLLKDIVIGNYMATWNLETDGQAWIIKPDSVSEVGCIHTCQGLEVDYIGVIVGPDFVVRDGSVQTWPANRSKMDKSIQGWKKLVKDNPEGGSARLDAIIKNTYRTLMTRGQKGCYVYFIDEETRRYFAERMHVSLEVEAIFEPPSLPAHVESVEVLPFRLLAPAEARPYENCVPLYDLKVAAGGFSDEQQIDDCEWVELPDVFRPQKGLFVAQVVGESMNRRIPNGAWCLFRIASAGSRNGKVVLASHREIADTDTSGHYTVKIYESTKENLGDGSWRHSSIILRPDSYLPGYEPVVLSEEQAENLRVVGELVAVLG